MYYLTLAEQELKYLKRKERINKDFVWTHKDVENLRTLNSELSKMQTELVDKIKSAYELFSKLEKNGMHFLHGFKVLGSFSFEKEIINEFDELEKLTIKQKEIVTRWENVSRYSRNEIGAWKLTFDSTINDFMPFSKVRLLQKEKYCWYLSIPKDEKTFELCSYLMHFLGYNRTFSNKDLAELTIKDFSPDVEVILNYDVSELKGFFNYRPNWEDKHNSIHTMLKERRWVLNNSFKWNEKNIQKILEVNSWLWEKTDELKKELSELKAFFVALSNTDPAFKYYSLEGRIEYYGSKENDIATLELQREMSKHGEFVSWSLRCDEDSSEIRDYDNECNWNSEVYSYHLSEEQKKIKFHYLMHCIFVDDQIYSFEDLVRMREEDFKVCLKISWYGE